MSCPWCDSRLHEQWEGGDLSTASPELALHWIDSPSCRASAELIARCRGVFPAVSAASPRSGFAEQVVARAQQERQRSQWIAGLGALAALMLAVAGLTWFALSGLTFSPTEVARRETNPAPAARVATAPDARSLDRLRRVVEPLETASRQTLSITKHYAGTASEKVRSILPRWEELEFVYFEEPWTVSALPVRVVSEAATAGLDPLATSTREVYQNVKQYLPPLTKRSRQQLSR